MTRLKLEDLADEKPVRLTIEVSARLHRELLAYATTLNGGDAKGAPTPVARTKVRPPNSQVGPILPAQRETLMKSNTAGRVYEKAVDRVSAHEILSKRADQLAEAEARDEERAARDKEAAKSTRSRSTSTGTTRSRSTRSGSSRTTNRRPVTPSVQRVCRPCSMRWKA